MLTQAIKTVSKIIGLQWKDPKWRPYRYILSQTRTHIMTINQHYSVSYAFSVPKLIRNVRSRRRIDSSSIIAHPVNSDLHTWERLLKCYAKNSTYIYIYIYVMLLIIDMDFLYQFNLGLIVPLFTVPFHEKFEKKIFFLNFKKLAGLWLAKWIIMLQFMDLRWPRVFRRCNVGLV